MSSIFRCHDDNSCKLRFAQCYTFRDHRKVLFVANLLILIGAALLSAFCAYLSIIMYDPEYNQFSWLMVVLSAAAGVLSFVCIVGMRGAHLVSLDLLLRYFWGVTVFIGPLLLGVVACLDFYQYTNSFFDHQWELPNFTGLHTLFCTKYIEFDVDAVAKCAAPRIDPDVWCRSQFNGATNCQKWRESAIEEAVAWGEYLMGIQSIVCIADLVLIVICLYLCYRIMKENVITQSMNDVINYLLILPICACALLSWYMWWLREYDVPNLQYSVLGESFAYLAGAQSLALPLGIIAGLVANGSIALVFAGVLPQIFEPTIKEVADLACGKGLTGCCCCKGYNPISQTTTTDRCPEWSTLEVQQLLVLDLKISCVISFASAIYLVGAFFVAILVMRNLANYKTDYVGVGKIVLTENMTISDDIDDNSNGNVRTVSSSAKPGSMLHNRQGSLSENMNRVRNVSFTDIHTNNKNTGTGIEEQGSWSMSITHSSSDNGIDTLQVEEGDHSIELGIIPITKRRGSGNMLRGDEQERDDNIEATTAQPLYKPILALDNTNTLVSMMDTDTHADDAVAIESSNVNASASVYETSKLAKKQSNEKRKKEKEKQKQKEKEEKEEKEKERGIVQSIWGFLKGGLGRSTNSNSISFGPSTVVGAANDSNHISVANVDVDVDVENTNWSHLTTTTATAADESQDQDQDDLWDAHLQLIRDDEDSDDDNDNDDDDDDDYVE